MERERREDRGNENPARDNQHPFNEQLRDNYGAIKTGLRSRYSQLTDEDLRYEEGQEDDFFRRLETRTGQTRQNLEKEVGGYGQRKNPA